VLLRQAIRIRARRGTSDARKQPHGQHIGRDIHVDSTEAETNARLLHICPDKSPCWEKWRSPYTRGRVIARSANANLDEVKAERHAASEIPEEERISCSSAPAGVACPWRTAG
jgi:hypothetical protein